LNENLLGINGTSAALLCPLLDEKELLVDKSSVSIATFESKHRLKFKIN